MLTEEELNKINNVKKVIKELEKACVGIDLSKANDPNIAKYLLSQIQRSVISCEGLIRLLEIQLRFTGDTHNILRTNEHCDHYNGE